MSYAAAKPAVVEPDMPTMLGRYRILGRIGKGGMGVVFKGFHLNLERHVAIKTLRLDKIATPDLVNRFRQEIKLVGQMDHPHVVRASDAGERNGVFYLVMEYLAGHNLEKVVNKCGPLKRGEACELIRQAALGLDYIHQSLIHRDIKPANLMLTNSGTVKILDLGLAHTDVPNTGEHHETPTGYVMGTHAYMAPEQARGSKAIDTRADIYSLGCTFFKLVTGQMPYSGKEYDTTAKQLYAHCHVPITSVAAFATIPEELKPIVLRMMAKDPEERYQTGKEVAEGLAPFAAGVELKRLADIAESVEDVEPLSPPLPEELSRLTESVLHTPREAPTVSTVAFVPGASRWKRWKLPIALGVCAAVFGVGLLIWAAVAVPRRFVEPGEPPRPAAPKTGLHDLDKLKAGESQQLIDRLPLAIGYDKHDPTRWIWNEKANSLAIFGKNDPVLLPLGVTKQARGAMAVTIHQGRWTGEVGVFWGYRDFGTGKADNFGRTAFARCHTITIKFEPANLKLPERYTVHRGTITFHRDKFGKTVDTISSVKKHPIKWLDSRDKVLEVRIQNKRIAEAWFASTELADLYSDEKVNKQMEAIPFDGTLGVFTTATDATFSKFSYTPN